MRTIGFCGPEGAGLFCCSNSETLSIWDPQAAQRVMDFGDVRSIARGSGDATDDGNREATLGRGKGWGVPVDYVVGCQYDASLDKLWLISGGFGGAGCVAWVTPGGITPEAVLSGGHREQIRAFDWLGQTVITGGEDAKICCWRTPGSGAGEGEDSRETSMMGVEGGSPSGGVMRTKADHRASRAYHPYDSNCRRR